MIDLDYVKQHLQIDEGYTLDDSLINQYIAAATMAVSKSIQRDLKDLEDVSGHLPSSLELAIIFLVSNFYENRSSVAFASSSEIPLSFSYLIAPYIQY